MKLRLILLLLLPFFSYAHSPNINSHQSRNVSAHSRLTEIWNVPATSTTPGINVKFYWSRTQPTNLAERVTRFSRAYTVFKQGYNQNNQVTVQTVFVALPSARHSPMTVFHVIGKNGERPVHFHGVHNGQTNAFERIRTNIASLD